MVSFLIILYIFSSDKTHMQVYMVPREWLGYKTLQCTLYHEVKLYNHRYGHREGCKIRLKGVTTRVERHADYFWARRDDDKEKMPRHRTYLAVSVPCVDCRMH